MTWKQSGAQSVSGTCEAARAAVDSAQGARSEPFDALDGHRLGRVGVPGDSELNSSRISEPGGLPGVSLADLIPLEEVTKVLPRRLHRSTVFRWAQKGRRGVRLKVVSMGGTRCTTERWLLEFFEAVEGARVPHEPTRSPRLRPRQRRRKPKAPARGQANPPTKEILRRHGLSFES